MVLPRSSCAAGQQYEKFARLILRVVPILFERAREVRNRNVLSTRLDQVTDLNNRGNDFSVSDLAELAAVR